MALMLSAGWVFEAGGLAVVATLSPKEAPLLTLTGPRGTVRVVMGWAEFTDLVHADEWGSDLSDEAVLAVFLSRVFANPAAYGARRAI